MVRGAAGNLDFKGSDAPEPAAGRGEEPGRDLGLAQTLTTCRDSLLCAWCPPLCPLFQ